MQPRSIDLWILTDYSEWQWVKRCQVSLEWHVKPKICPHGHKDSINLVSIPSRVMNRSGRERFVQTQFAVIYSQKNHFYCEFHLC
jgi:hypothetical protein